MIFFHFDLRWLRYDCFLIYGNFTLQTLYKPRSPFANFRIDKETRCCPYIVSHSVLDQKGLQLRKQVRLTPIHKLRVCVVQGMCDSGCVSMILFSFLVVLFFSSHKQLTLPEQTMIHNSPSKVVIIQLNNDVLS